MKTEQLRKLTLAAVAASLLFLGAGCLGGQQATIKPVRLDYWRADDEPETMADALAAYKKIHPNVEIVYTKLRSEDYERLLLEAFAEDRGPDIFSIPNVWLSAWRGKIQPMPPETVIPTQQVNAQKKIVTVNVKTPTMTILEMRNAYVEAVTKEVIRLGDRVPDKPRENRIFGIPFSVDTLAMFYNKDLLRRANIEKPPTTWSEVQQQAGKLTILDDKKVIKQSGAALGGAYNVLYFTDILSAIMMQNGATMADDLGYPRFERFTEERTGSAYPPGIEALVYYQSFATEGTPGYSWNPTMPNSLDAFVTGKTAFFFGYPVDIRRIKERAPRLDFGIAPLPQIDPAKAANIAAFPVEVVAKKTEHPNEAWDLLLYLARPEQVAQFLAASKRPTALRELVTPQLADAEIGPFVGQVLTAKTWYKGVDFSAVEKAFAEMIVWRPTLRGEDYTEIASQAASKIGATIERQ